MPLALQSITDPKFRFNVAKAAEVDASNYRSVMLWIHGGEVGGQKVTCDLVQTGVAFVGQLLPPLPKGSYGNYTIALETFGKADDKVLNPPLFQGAKEMLAFYFDHSSLDPCNPKCRLSLRESNAAFTERKTTLAKLTINRTKP